MTPHHHVLLLFDICNGVFSPPAYCPQTLPNCIYSIKQEAGQLFGSLRVLVGGRDLANGTVNLSVGYFDRHPPRGWIECTQIFK